LRKEEVVLIRTPNYIHISNHALNSKIQPAMTKSVFYHAGCSVCVSAEHDIINLIGENNVEVVHIGVDRSRIDEAEKAGVKSVPALVTPAGNVLHINYGASMEDVKG
jgi:glutaredoxin 3